MWLLSCGQRNSPTATVICLECNTNFVVLNDGFEISTVGFPKAAFEGLVFKQQPNGELYADKIDIDKTKNGVAVEKIYNPNFIYPMLVKHPR